MGKNINKDKVSSTYYKKKATQLASLEKDIKPPKHIIKENDKRIVTSSIEKVKEPLKKKKNTASISMRPFPQKERLKKKEIVTKTKSKNKKKPQVTKSSNKKVNTIKEKKVTVSEKKMQAMASYYNRMIRRYTIISLVFLLLSAWGFFFFSSHFQKATVIGESMEPTLYPNDNVLYQSNVQLERFDLVVFPPNKSSKELYVKRIIGMPGESVRYKDDVLYVDGLAIEEPYLDDAIKNFEKANSEFYTQDFDLSEIPNINQDVDTIPDGYYLLLGDNRNNSTDSRTIGLISKDLIQGVVRFRYSPLSRIGFL